MNNIIFSSTTNMLLIKERKILLIERSEAKTFSGRYMLPGGKQEEHETPKEAAIRETFEETGVVVKRASLEVIATNYHEYKGKVYLVYIFTSSDFEGELKESKEGIPQWIPMQEALGNPKLYPDLKRHIGLILESNSPEIIFTYHRFNEKLEIVESR